MRSNARSGLRSFSGATFVSPTVSVSSVKGVGANTPVPVDSRAGEAVGIAGSGNARTENAPYLLCASSLPPADTVARVPKASIHPGQTSRERRSIVESRHVARSIRSAGLPEPAVHVCPWLVAPSDASPNPGFSTIMFRGLGRIDGDGLLRHRWILEQTELDSRKRSVLPRRRRAARSQFFGKKSPPPFRSSAITADSAKKDGRSCRPRKLEAGEHRAVSRQIRPPIAIDIVFLLENARAQKGIPSDVLPALPARMRLSVAPRVVRFTAVAVHAASAVAKPD